MPLLAYQMDIIFQLLTALFAAWAAYRAHQVKKIIEPIAPLFTPLPKN